MNLKCDFCSDTDIRYRYPATSFPDGLGSESVGDWAACSICHAMIEAGDREALAARSLDTFIHNHPCYTDQRVAISLYLITLLAKFFAHRTGAAIAL